MFLAYTIEHYIDPPATFFPGRFERESPLRAGLSGFAQAHNISLTVLFGVLGNQLTTRAKEILIFQFYAYFGGNTSSKNAKPK